jgi:hypothetical protein
MFSSYEEFKSIYGDYTSVNSIPLISLSLWNNDLLFDDIFSQINVKIEGSTVLKYIEYVEESSLAVAAQLKPDDYHNNFFCSFAIEFLFFGECLQKF